MQIYLGGNIYKKLALIKEVQAMPRLVSVQVMLQYLVNMIGTEDLTDWERIFVQDMEALVAGMDGSTSCLSSKQVEKIESIYRKHFA